MAAPTSTMMREAGYLDTYSIEIYHIIYSPLITFQTMLVTGGYDGSAPLSSTELMVGTASAWVFTGELPSPRWGLCGVKIENKVLMTGNNNYNTKKPLN